MYFMRRWWAAAIAVLLVAGIFLAGCAAPKKTPETGKKPDTQSEQPQPGKNGEPDNKTEPDKKPEPGVNDYFPASVGSTWLYLGEGNEYATFNRDVIYAEGNKAQVREDNGGTVSAAVFEISRNAVTRVFFQGESYEATNFLERQTNENLIILKGPLAAGTKWQGKDGPREIVDTGAVMETPAGRFKCIKVKITDPNSTSYEYYAKGVGLVKREFISGDTSVTSTLEKYTIK